MVVPRVEVSFRIVHPRAGWKANKDIVFDVDEDDDDAFFSFFTTFFVVAVITSSLATSDPAATVAVAVVAVTDRNKRNDNNSNNDNFMLILNHSELFYAVVLIFSCCSSLSYSILCCMILLTSYSSTLVAVCLSIVNTIMLCGFLSNCREFYFYAFKETRQNPNRPAKIILWFKACGREEWTCWQTTSRWDTAHYN